MHLAAEPFSNYCQTLVCCEDIDTIYKQVLAQLILFSVKVYIRPIHKRSAREKQIQAIAPTWRKRY